MMFVDGITLQQHNPPLRSGFDIHQPLSLDSHEVKPIQ
jgi:hypothetical protein